MVVGQGGFNIAEQFDYALSKMANALIY